MAKTNIDLDLGYLPRLPKDKSTPIGCIGSGFIMADCHLVAYKKAGFNPVAIASHNPEKALKVAERHDCCRKQPLGHRAGSAANQRNSNEFGQIGLG